MNGQSVEVRFLNKIDFPEDQDGCWTWKAYVDRDGYGTFYVGHVNGKRIDMKAHRFSYELFRDKVPNGLVIDHLCRNTSCVNPFHLEPVTSLENLLRSPFINSDHCRRGHQYTLENTAYWKNRRGGLTKVCKICRYGWYEKQRAKKSCSIPGAK